MELINIVNEMDKLICSLSELSNKINNIGAKKTAAIANYEKVIAITIIKLRNGIALELEGHKINSPPITLIDKIAKGICWREKLEADTAENEYKNLLTKIEIIKSQLSAYQSINRNLEHI